MEGSNLSGPDAALEQLTWSGRKVNWIILLTRGRVAVNVMPEDWELDGAGMAEVVRRLEGWLRELLGDDVRLPRVLFTDRGTGMYAPSGRIVATHNNALRETGFRSFMGPDAKAQAPDMGDLLLHETAASWFRNRLRRIKPRCLPWEERHAQWTRRAQVAVEYVNENYDAEQLCRDFPDRLRECQAASGGRLRT